MTPIEKAKELFDKFYPRATSYSCDRKNQNENTKQCALIAVDEIIQVIDPENIKMFLFWKQVKIEIEKKK